MRSLPILFCIAILVACQQASVKQPVKDSIPVTAKTADTAKPVYKYPKYTSSSFRSGFYETDAIFGTWANSMDAPACAFKINAKHFMYCDGNEELFYHIIEDVILMDTIKGEILKAENDTLIILWDGTDSEDVKVRWKG